MPSEVACRLAATTTACLLVMKQTIFLPAPVAINLDCWLNLDKRICKDELTIFQAQLLLELELQDNVSVAGGGMGTIPPCCNEIYH